MNLLEEGKLLLAVTNFEATNAVSYYIIDKNKTFSFSTPSYWTPQGDEDFNNKLNKLLEIRSEIDIELHVKELEKRGTRTKTENSGLN